MMLTSKPKPNTAQMYKTMLAKCEQLQINDWARLKPLIAGELDSFLLMLKWIKEMRVNNEISIEQARIHIDIQKNTMRTRMMAYPGLTLVTSDNILNECIDQIRLEIYEYVGWVVI